MKKRIGSIAIALALAAPLAEAVSLSPGGTGQVLLYPYYTVNGGNQTLLLLGNSTNQSKAVRVQFNEGRNGRNVLSFNVYLSPYDMFTAGIFSTGDSVGANISGAGLVTDDNSCTVPTIKSNEVLPKLADGRHYAPFRNYAYTGPFNDAGSDELSRTREGQIEVIEMGTLIPGSPAYFATLHRDTMPENCGYLIEGWSPDGFWSKNPKTDLNNPTGGLFGNVAIVNASEGTMLTYTAEALEEFRQDPTDVPRGSKNSVVLHTQGSSAEPNLANALTDPAKHLASASVFVDGRLIRADYPDTRGIDAVTAVLMANTLSNDYVIEESSRAQSEWVLSFPTKRFYTDEALVGATAIAPFTTIYPKSGSERNACMTASYTLFNREEQTPAPCFDGTPPPGESCHPIAEICYAVNTLLMNKSKDDLIIDIDPPLWERQSFLGSNLGVFLGGGYPYDFGFTSGWMQLDFSGAMRSGILVGEYPSYTLKFEGLPAIGFLATNYVNRNVTPGVLANYSGAYKHRTTSRSYFDGAF